MNGSLLLEIHGWRGLKVERDLFCVHLVCGFLTVLVCKLLVTDKMEEFRDKLTDIEKAMTE